VRRRHGAGEARRRCAAAYARLGPGLGRHRVDVPRRRNGREQRHHHRHGGTSFDVSIIHDAKPAYSFISNTHQYEYFLPKVDLQAIGAGGGSLARVQPETRTMTVGPDSAGAFPGPVCYGRGGTVPP